MRDILREYRDAVREMMAEDLETVHRELLGGRVDNMERYKFLMGKIEGLNSAASSADAALKKMRTFDDE